MRSVDSPGNNKSRSRSDSFSLSLFPIWPLKQRGGTLVRGNKQNKRRCIALSARQPEPGTNHSGDKGAICSSVFWYGGRVCSITAGIELGPCLRSGPAPAPDLSATRICVTADVRHSHKLGYDNATGISHAASCETVKKKNHHAGVRWTPSGPAAWKRATWPL